MDVFYNNVANDIIKHGVNKFSPAKYRIEYRKNRSDADLIKLIEMVDSRCSELDERITILSISLKNIFKKMRKRKFTIVYNKDSNSEQKHIETEEPIDNIKNKYGDSALVFSGHCKMEKG